ncbi:MAG: lipoyl(octanoyl) transferase LipB [Actinobacteria bacterium]|nr:lipoyl(octanoyl) transferase LipB [Actinomycetota bacterium]
MRELKVIDFKKLIEYKEGLKLQRFYEEKSLNGKTDFLLLLEHYPVITIGKSGNSLNILFNEDALKNKEVSVYHTDRGGDVTYHGPGQLVGYPILNLRYYKKDVKWYVKSLEEVLINVLNEYGIKAEIIPKLIGVWVKNKKIASIGVRIRKWITTHGFALNVNNDLTPFSYIIPCGIKDVDITSMKEVLNKEIDMKKLKKNIIKEFKSIL